MSDKQETNNKLNHAWQIADTNKLMPMERHNRLTARGHDAGRAVELAVGHKKTPVFSW